MIKLAHKIKEKLFCRIRTFLAKNGISGKNAKIFLRYAIPAKLHFWRYRSRKVIMLRMDLIGDCTMWTSSAIAVRKFYGDREMTMVCLSISKPIFERLGIFDRIITVDFRPESINFDKLPRLIAELRDDSYDLLLQPQISKMPVADILAAAIKCNKRIAIETKEGNSPRNWIRLSNFLYDKRIPYSRDTRSEFDFYGAFVRGIGCSDYKTTCPVLPYKKQHFIDCDYFVIFPGASLTQKNWPADRFAQIANHIYKQTGLAAVILGAGGEQPIADRLKGHLSPQTAINVMDLVGKTSLFDVIDIIGNAKLIVTNDTSGVHIACAVKTPSVVTVGGYHPDRFLPYHIENITPEDHLPLVAFTPMPCFYCDWNWDIVGKRNEECLHRLKCGEPSECIENVTYEQVRQLVDLILDKEGLIC